MAKKQRFIIRNEIQQFWTGFGWSDEYPDAMIYDKKREVTAAALKAQFRAVRVFVETVE